MDLVFNCVNGLNFMYICTIEIDQVMNINVKY